MGKWSNKRSQAQRQQQQVVDISKPIVVDGTNLIAGRVASNVATLTESDKDDERILTVESTGALNPKHIIVASVEQLSSRLSEFKSIISEIK